VEPSTRRARAAEGAKQGEKGDKIQRLNREGGTGKGSCKGKNPSARTSKANKEGSESRDASETGSTSRNVRKAPDRGRARYIRSKVIKEEEVLPAKGPKKKKKKGKKKQKTFAIWTLPGKVHREVWNKRGQEEQLGGKQKKRKAKLGPKKPPKRDKSRDTRGTKNPRTNSKPSTTAGGSATEKNPKRRGWGYPPGRGGPPKGGKLKESNNAKWRLSTACGGLG